MAPKTLPVRPTTDFAKEALFNILQNRLDFSEISLLDLFSGTGNISYEFASRGTTEIISVDAHYACVEYIKKTAEVLGFPIQAIKADAFKYITTGTTPFNIIFADPPYDFDIQSLKRFVEIIFENKLLKPGGFLIIEHSKHNQLAEFSHFEEARRYGGSVFSFFS